MLFHVINIHTEMQTVKRLLNRKGKDASVRRTFLPSVKMWKNI